MANRVKTKWTKKQPGEVKKYKSIRLKPNNFPGATAVASWLANTKPENILEELREYQQDWCNHAYHVIATVKHDMVTKQIIRCSECSHITSTTKKITNAG